MDKAIFWFMVVGCLAGSVQHLFAFENVAKDLTPIAMVGSSVQPAAAFWGGDFAAALFLAQGGTVLFFRNDPAVRRFYLTATGSMFSLLALAWLRKGDAVGNPNKWQVMGFDLVLAGSAFVGAALTKTRESDKQA